MIAARRPRRPAHRRCDVSPAKAEQIRTIARRADEKFAGVLPCDPELLRSFRGVGPKCAHLALGIACGQTRISVDVHDSTCPVLDACRRIGLERHR